MHELNEKLAELCGYPCITQDGLGSFVEMKPSEWHQWNPTTDLNQLERCYEAAENAFVAEHEEVDFDTAFAFALRNLLIDKGCQSTVSIELASAWVKHPELIAQAILKAKGVI